ncbi:MAG TPA: hypothetical protein VG013_41505 [Gemmataceae bacterium]|jgi:hypothetical protein|nr:hypothetical protein [Gemmataceae bacterium]
MAKKLNLKDIDYKQFFLEKGERVGLWVGIALMVLLLAVGARMAWSSTRADNAGKIKKLAQDKQGAIDRSKIPEERKLVPQDLQEAANPKLVDSHDYPADRPWFYGSSLEDTKWRQPAILGLGPAQAQVLLTLLNDWDFADDETIVMRVPQKSDEGSEDETRKRLKKLFPQKKFQGALRRRPSGDQPGAGMMGGQMMGAQMMGGMGGMAGMRGGQMMGGMAGMRGGGPMMGGMAGMRGGMSGMMGGPMMGGMAGMRGGMAGQMPGNPMMANQGSMMTGPGKNGFNSMGTSSKEEWTLVPTKIKDFAQAKGEPARIAMPARIAVVEASFPIKEQLEEIRKALRYPSVEAMLGDGDKIFLEQSRKQQRTIEFLGFRVERRALWPSGEEADGWREIDIDKPYLATLFPNVNKVPEDEDFLRYGLIVRQIAAKRLVMPRLDLIREDQKYNKTNLEEIEKALAAQKERYKGNEPEAAPKDRRFDKDNFDPYGDDDDSGGPGPAMTGGAGGLPRTTMPPNMGKPGRGYPGAGPEGPDMRKRMLPGATGNKSTGTTAPEDTFPSACLVRLIDVTVQPGYTYEYRVQVKMANPLYQREALAVARSLTTEKYLLGPKNPAVLKTRVDDKEVPLQVKVPAEAYYYAVDEKPEGRKSVMPADQDRAAVQVHLWLDQVQTDANNKGSRALVGEWSIAERDLAYRGEYLGSQAWVEVPIWDPRQEAFVFAAPPDRAKSRSHKGVPVDFGLPVLLVDFEGGGHAKSYSVGSDPRNKITVTDDIPAELLVLSDGRLLVHNSRVDTKDDARKARLDKWRKRLGDIRDAEDSQKDGSEPGKKGKNLQFDDPNSKSK